MAYLQAQFPAASPPPPPTRQPTITGTSDTQILCYPLTTPAGGHKWWIAGWITAAVRTGLRRIPFPPDVNTRRARRQKWRMVEGCMVEGMRVQTTQDGCRRVWGSPYPREDTGRVQVPVRLGRDVQATAQAIDTGAASENTDQPVPTDWRGVDDPIVVDNDPIDPWTIRAHERALLCSFGNANAPPVVPLYPEPRPYAHVVYPPRRGRRSDVQRWTPCRHRGERSHGCWCGC